MSRAGEAALHLGTSLLCYSGFAQARKVGPPYYQYRSALRAERCCLSLLINRFRLLPHSLIMSSVYRCLVLAYRNICTFIYSEVFSDKHLWIWVFERTQFDVLTRLDFLLPTTGDKPRIEHFFLRGKRYYVKHHKVGVIIYFQKYSLSSWKSKAAERWQAEEGKFISLTSEGVD